MTGEASSDFLKAADLPLNGGWWWLWESKGLNNTEQSAILSQPKNLFRKLPKELIVHIAKDKACFRA